MVFMLCFQKQPFETKLSAINGQYFLPESHPYSEGMMELIGACFTANPLYRPTAKQVKEKLGVLMAGRGGGNGKERSEGGMIGEEEFERVLEGLRGLKHTKEEGKSGGGSWMDRMKRLYTQMTTETAGWIEGFIEDSDEAPNLKYNRSILSKCW